MRDRKKARQGRRFGKKARATVCVCTPCEGTVKTEYTMSLVDMFMTTFATLHSPVKGTSMQAFGSSLLPHSRQVLTDYATREPGKFTHLLWLDSDMKFPADTLLRLVAHDVPIVGINASTRIVPPRACAQLESGAPVVTTAESTGLIEVRRCGFGVLLVKLEVFEHMSRPFYDFEYISEAEGFRGEDYYFCKKAAEIGYTIVIDQDLSKQVEHIGAIGFKPQMIGVTGEQS